jgi:hypothetical protein
MTINTFILSICLFALPFSANAHDPKASEKDTKTLMERTQKRHPERCEKLERLRKENPVAFRKTIRRKQRHLKHQGPQSSPDDRKKAQALRDRFNQTLKRYQSADEAHKPELRNELITAATEIFETRQTHRLGRLQKLHKDIADLESEIKDRNENQAALIQDFVEEKTKNGLQGL